MLASAVLALGGAAAPVGATVPFAQQELRLTMDDGVQLAATYYEPTAPRASDPVGVLVLHGIGGTRRSVEPVSRALASAGFPVVTYDARAHGQSGGLFSAAGPREIADLRAVTSWLTARPGVRDDGVAAWGISYGGGQVLRALVEGVPIRSAVVAQTWVDLYSALVPGNLAKSGAVLGFVNSVAAGRRSPEVNAIAADALASRNLGAVRDFAARRSSVPGLANVPAPVLFLQGRRDFVFGLDQGLAARASLRAANLYIGPFGHAPSTFPGPDVDAVLRRTVDWYRLTLEGGAQVPPSGLYALAPDPYRPGAERQFTRPDTRVARFTARGTSRIGGTGSFTRSLGRTRTLLETFGAPVVRLRASGTFPHVVAVLQARTPAGTEIVVSEGGARVRLGARPRTVTLRLASQATTIPRGSRLTLRIGSTSGDLLYISPAPATSRLTAGRTTVSLPVLRRPVSG